MCKGRAIAFRKSTSACKIVYCILKKWSTGNENFVKEFEKTVDRVLKNCYDGHKQRNDRGADEVYVVTITGTLSGAYNAALLAGEEYEQSHEGARVFVLDSLSTGAESRLLVERLAALIKAGKPFDTVCEEIRAYHEHTHLLANLARNGRVKPAVAAVARMLGIRVIGQASDAGDLEVLCKTRGEHGALERMVLEMKAHGLTNGRVHIDHCCNAAAAERLKHMVHAVFPEAKVEVGTCGALCSYYAEYGGLMVGYEDNEAPTV